MKSKNTTTESPEKVQQKMIATNSDRGNKPTAKRATANERRNNLTTATSSADEHAGVSRVKKYEYKQPKPLTW